MNCILKGFQGCPRRECGVFDLKRQIPFISPGANKGRELTHATKKRSVGTYMQNVRSVQRM